MFALSDVFHFLAHKLACLSRRRFPFALVLTRPFSRFFFWHNKKSFAPSYVFGRNEKCLGSHIYPKALGHDELTTTEAKLILVHG
jgi:hypothetical protein